MLTPIWLLIIDLFDGYKYAQNNKCLRLAIDKLEGNKNLIVIGITGSNGKTSVKEILNQLLSKKFDVITTAKNQNTPKGAIIAINKNLSADTEIFICEMGAKNVGDINELCTLVNPSKAIITSVCGQHLETFKNVQNVYTAKKELHDYIDKGFCVYNLDNQFVNKMYTEKLGAKSGVSLSTLGDLYASNIHIVNYQTYFDIHYNNQIYPCHTRLLGEHNITNILLALRMALHLGVDINHAIQTIINLAPISHRLEYIKSHIDIIDDSYNCSIDSAHEALKVLNQIPKLKVVCTPGIIEGGKYQFKLNSQLSSILADVCDIVIIVGKTNRRALISNLTDYQLMYISTSKLMKQNTSKSIKIGNTRAIKIHINNVATSNKKRAYIINTLNDAKKLFGKLLNSSYTLLLLNDLPDEYN